MTFWTIYPIIFGPFWIVQEICERCVVEGNDILPVLIVLVGARYFKKRIERAEKDTDITIFQMQHRLNCIDSSFNNVSAVSVVFKNTMHP